MSPRFSTPPRTSYKAERALLFVPGLSSVALFAMKLASLTFVTAVLSVASSLVGAVPVGPQEIEKLSTERLFLLRLGPDVDPVWRTEEEKWELKRAGVTFMDVTETWAGMRSDPAFQKPSEKVSTTATCTLCQIGCGIDRVSHVS